jgi:2',5'-phosphodiesterase
VEAAGAAEGSGSFPEPLPRAEGAAFRVLTYNILADQYSSQEYSRKVLFAHVAPHMLDVHWRKQRVLREVLRSAADVVALQEVDAKVYDRCAPVAMLAPVYPWRAKRIHSHRFLEPLMRREGFAGWYANKAGQVTEGSALFYREELFELVAKYAPLTALSARAQLVATSAA